MKFSFEKDDKYDFNPPEELTMPLHLKVNKTSANLVGRDSEGKQWLIAKIKYDGSVYLSPGGMTALGLREEK